MKHYYTKRIPDDLYASLLESGWKELRISHTYADAFDIAIHNGLWIEVEKYFDGVSGSFSNEYEWGIIVDGNYVASSDLPCNSWWEAADEALEAALDIMNKR